MAKTFTDDETGEKYEIPDATALPGIEVLSALNYQGFTLIKPKPQQPVRWRAERSGQYWYVKSQLEAEVTDDYRLTINEYYYDLGNYFKSRDQAEAAADAVKALFEYIQDPHSLQPMRKLTDKAIKARELTQGNKP